MRSGTRSRRSAENPAIKKAAEIKLEDGRRYNAKIIDLSLSGAAIDIFQPSLLAASTEKLSQELVEVLSGIPGASSPQ